MKLMLRFGLGVAAAWMLLIAQAAMAQATSPWFDVLAYGAKCDGSTSDATAIQSALTAAAAVSGTVITPPGKTCVVEKPLILDNFAGVKVIGGFGGNPLPGNPQSTWKFTATCTGAAGPCLSIRSAQAVSFRNLELSFPNATAGPMVDLSHSSAGVDSSLITFDGVAFAGPGNSVGPIVLDQNTDGVTFQGWTSFVNASIFVEGPVNNAAGYSDKTVFDRVNFLNPGTAAIQNASVDWTISNSIFQIFLPGSVCTPVLQYVNGYTGEQSLLVSGNVVNSTGGNCINTFSVFSLPAVSGNLGGATYLSNLFISGTTAGTQTEITAGANQVVTASGNLFNHIGTALSVGSGVFVDFGPNVYSDVSTQIQGTPAAGRSLLSGGASVIYSGLTIGPGASITSSGWGGTMSSMIASGVVGLGGASIGAGICGTPVSASASGVQTTDAISFSYAGAIGANPGVLTVQTWPSVNAVNFMYCNPTSMTITPPVATLNWRVVR